MSTNNLPNSSQQGSNDNLDDVLLSEIGKDERVTSNEENTRETQSQENPKTLENVKNEGISMDDLPMNIPEHLPGIGGQATENVTVSQNLEQEGVIGAEQRAKTVQNQTENSVANNTQEKTPSVEKSPEVSQETEKTEVVGLSMDDLPTNIPDNLPGIGGQATENVTVSQNVQQVDTTRPTEAIRKDVKQTSNQPKNISTPQQGKLVQKSINTNVQGMATGKVMNNSISKPPIASAGNTQIPNESILQGGSKNSDLSSNVEGGISSLKIEDNSNFNNSLNQTTINTQTSFGGNGGFIPGGDLPTLGNKSSNTTEFIGSSSDSGYGSIFKMIFLILFFVVIGIGVFVVYQTSLYEQIPGIENILPIESTTPEETTETTSPTPTATSVPLRSYSQQFIDAFEEESYLVKGEGKISIDIALDLLRYNPYSDYSIISKEEIPESELTAEEVIFRNDSFSVNNMSYVFKEGVLVHSRLNPEIQNITGFGYIYSLEGRHILINEEIKEFFVFPKQSLYTQDEDYYRIVFHPLNILYEDLKDEKIFFSKLDEDTFRTTLILSILNLKEGIDNLQIEVPIIIKFLEDRFLPERIVFDSTMFEDKEYIINLNFEPFVFEYEEIDKPENYQSVEVGYTENNAQEWFVLSSYILGKNEESSDE